MPNSTPRSKRERRRPDPAKLARIVVDHRLEFCADGLEFIDDNPDGRWSRMDFDQVVDAVLARWWPEIAQPRAARQDLIIGSNEGTKRLLEAFEDAYADAGFLVGLELGRRLAGGVR